LCDFARPCASSICGFGNLVDVWGRDYVLQHFQRHTDEELAALGLTWADVEELPPE
jgi:hypothetical protein